jgi:MFS family permease
MAANYTASAIVSITIGRVSDLLGRPCVMAFAGSCLCCMFVVLKYYPPTTALTIYGLAVVIGLGLSALRTPLSAQLSANYLDQTEAAFAASEMCSTVTAALGFLFAQTLSLDAKLDAAGVMSILGFGCYFIEAWLRGSEGAESLLAKRKAQQQHTQSLASQRYDRYASEQMSTYLRYGSE